MRSALLRMREMFNTASGTEKILIEYFLAHTEDILEYSIHELAEKTTISSATILRFCKKLGFSGYKRFRLAVSYEMALRKKDSDNEEKELTRFDNLHEIVEKITHKNIISLEDTQSLVDYDVLEQCVSLICECKSLHLFGIGSSLCVARDAYLKFLRVSKSCILNDDWHLQLLQARNMTQEDVGIVISYSGQTVEIVECMKTMRENKSPIIAITRYGTSPVTELSTFNLYVAANESIFRSGAMSSRISQLNIIDILYTAYANRTYEYSMDRLSKTHIHKPSSLLHTNLHKNNE